jgi:hypothetical protein
MNERNQSSSIGIWRSVSTLKTAAFWIGSLAACYLAVLPMSGTIALRNVVLFALCACLVWSFLDLRPPLHWPIPLLLWATYLAFFPFISDSPIIAAHSLLGQWGRGLLAMLAGAGVAAVFIKSAQGTAFHLGLISSLPILIHLCLFVWKAWDTSSIPWGYWGRETHHADLGYAAGQSVVLLAAAMVTGSSTCRRWAVALIVACLLSTALANSRGGFLFALTGCFLVIVSVYAARSTYRRRNILLGMASLLVAGLAFFSIAVKEDSRWTNMTSDLVAGLLGNAIEIECEGTSSIESTITAQYGSGEKAQSVIFSVQGGDGARVVVLRAGIALAVKHPWGSDGSKWAYQHLLREECSDPVILMAHTHNGWVDTILALGWVGGVLYLMVFSYFFIIGYNHLRRSAYLNEWAIVLVAMASFWILRGTTDSVFKDHMLEMQGFVLSYAAANLWLRRRVSSSAREEKERPICPR